MNNKHDKELLKLPLQIELEAASRRGVTLRLGNVLSSPEEIAKAHIVEETGTYMRDYIQNENGKVTELRFDKINDR